MKDVLLEIKNLCFSYDEKKIALDQVSLSVAAGEKIAVLGANGAGKSTLFLSLNGVRTPDSGEIRFKGELIGKKNRRILCRNVGLVFQEAEEQLIASTVKADVAFGPLNMGMTREEADRTSSAAIAQMNLKGYEKRPPHYLSGGEKKRVSIAGILAMEPEIILFDEPTASLDPRNAAVLEQVLCDLEQQGKTILISTHDVDFAYRFAERILVFAEGKLIGDGIPQEIFAQEEILAAANLKKPVMLEVCGLLRRRGILPENAVPCKTVKELEDLYLY